jgi:hypothetical protein
VFPVSAIRLDAQEDKKGRQGQHQPTQAVLKREAHHEAIASLFELPAVYDSERRPKQYDVLNRPREVLRDALLQQDVAA